MRKHQSEGDDVRTRIADAVYRMGHGETMTRARIERLYRVSRATAKRDMVALERAIPCRTQLAVDGLKVLALKRR
jgi:hypothetical protein